MCKPECSNSAITQGEEIYRINSRLCTEYIYHFETSQCVEVCPVNCIPKDPDKTETEVELQIKYEYLMSESIVSGT